MAHYGEHMKNARESVGVTQVELAERLGVAQRTVSGWEIGARAPTFTQMVAVAQALDVPICRMTGEAYKCCPPRAGS